MRACLIALAVTGCWSNPPPPAAPVMSTSTPRAQPTEKELLDAASGAFSPDGQFQKDANVPHVQGALFGWRMRLACNDQEVRFTETVLLPGPGDWNTDDNSKVSDDGASAKVTSSEVCNPDGWIEKIWGLAENDPIGSYTIIVKVEGYREQQFKLTIVDQP